MKERWFEEGLKYPKGLNRLRKRENAGQTSGAKALLILLALSARLKPCPVTKQMTPEIFRSL